MSAFYLCGLLALWCSDLRLEPDKGPSEKLLEIVLVAISEKYDFTVKWQKPTVFDKNSVLEIGQGNGHGATLGWLRFLPGKEGVEVLSIRYEGSRDSYTSQWPPDLVPVVIEKAKISSEMYAELLRNLGLVDSAQLELVDQKSFGFSTNDFWLSAKLQCNKKIFFDMGWAGYGGSELIGFNYAKPFTAVYLANGSLADIPFQKHELTKEERSWVSAKWIADWKRTEKQGNTWWVKERSIMLIGVVGDDTVLPTLREILQADLERGSKSRFVYYAINAVTRLQKQDVRDKPVVEMDLIKNRKKVLELIPESPQ